jgi:hypothetical protein
MTLKDYRNGDIIYKQGDIRLKYFYVVLEGSVNVWVRQLFNFFSSVFAHAMFEGARNARGGERLLFMGHLAESECSLHMFPKVD